MNSLLKHPLLKLIVKAQCKHGSRKSAPGKNAPPPPEELPPKNCPQKIFPRKIAHHEIFFVIFYLSLVFIFMRIFVHKKNLFPLFFLL